MNRSYPALRGVAILLVILNHSIHMAFKYADGLGWLDKSAGIYRVLSTAQGLGAFAVPIFLFLSGCFFAYAASRGDLAANYRVVLVNLKHVAIPYLIWSLIFYAEILIFHGTRFSALGYLKNLLVGYPFNFVPLLIFYYAISPLLIRVFRRLGWWLIGLIGLYQLFLMVVLHPQQIGLALPGAFRLLAPPVLAAPLAEWALYFPLGLVAVLQAERLGRIIPRLAWVLAGLTGLFFALGTLDGMGVLNASLARQLCPIPFVLLSTIFQRQRIPLVRPLELLGKRAYGLYLTNLLTLDLVLLLVRAAAPGLLAFYWLLAPLLAALALFIPLALMVLLERRLKPVTFRYAFG